MSLRTTLRDHLVTVWVGDPWYGNSGRKILDGVTAAEAAQHPIPGVQSIWEFVLHLTAWTEECARRVEGESAHDPVLGDWPAVPSATDDAAWKVTIDDLGKARQHVLDAIEQAHEENLYGQVAGVPAGTTPRTRAETAAGLAEHDVYHFGQIALVKKAIRHTTGSK